MARIRSVKPELRTSEVVASWPLEVRYFFVLLWGYLDDKGRGLDVPKTIAGDCFPHDEKITAPVIGRWLALMATKPADPDRDAPICRYEIAGRRYVHCTNWGEHQHPNRPRPSRLPACPRHELLTAEPGSDAYTVQFSATDTARGTAKGSALDSEAARAPSLPGAAAGSSRGAGQQQQQARSEPVTEPPPPAAVALLLEILGSEAITGAEAAAIADRVQRDRRPRNLPGLLRTIAAAGELPELLDAVRADVVRAARTEVLARSRRDPVCAHGEPGGASPHPVTGLPLCPLCRSERVQVGGGMVLEDDVLVLRADQQPTEETP